VRAVLKAAGAAVPEDLGRRAAAIDNEAQLRTFLRDVWPGEAPATKKLDEALVQGLLDSVPGEPSLLTELNLKVMDEVNNNRYVGLGIQLAMHAEERRPQIRIPFPRGTAYRG